MPVAMAHEPQPAAEPLPEQRTPVRVVESRPRASRWRQPRGESDAYVEIERRDLAALTSLRFFAAAYVVVHHLVNIALLHAQGADADRSATWYLAWATQGHVGVTFFFVLSGFILAWCYHRSFATTASTDRPTVRRRFWRARWARVWPLHAAMFVAFVPIALQEAGTSIAGLWQLVWQGACNLLLLHAWVPFGGPDGLADTFNAPSWTLSVEACFYALFPVLAVLLVRHLRWGIAQLGLLAVAGWVALGGLGMALAGSERGEWVMRVFPPVRLVDFVVGIVIGLVVVQGLQQRVLDGRAQRPSVASPGWTVAEGLVLVAACASPLVWALAASSVLPDTLGTSWFHLPTIAAAILVISLERGAISRRLLAWRPLVWLGEVSYALYLVHLFIVLAAYHVGLYELVGPWVASLLLAAVAIAVAGFVHVRFEQPMRARLAGRRS